MPRKPEGARPMTAAERQARRRGRVEERIADLEAALRRIADGEPKPRQIAAAALAQAR